LQQRQLHVYDTVNVERVATIDLKPLETEDCAIKKVAVSPTAPVQVALVNEESLLRIYDVTTSSVVFENQFSDVFGSEKLVMAGNYCVLMTFAPDRTQPAGAFGYRKSQMILLVSYRDPVSRTWRSSGTFREWFEFHLDFRVEPVVYVHDTADEIILYLQLTCVTAVRHMVVPYKISPTEIVGGSTMPIHDGPRADRLFPCPDGGILISHNTSGGLGDTITTRFSTNGNVVSVLNWGLRRIQRACYDRFARTQNLLVGMYKQKREDGGIRLSVARVRSMVDVERPVKSWRCVELDRKMYFEHVTFATPSRINMILGIQEDHDESGIDFELVSYKL
jgi:hypothetical protein